MFLNQKLKQLQIYNINFCSCFNFYKGDKNEENILWSIIGVAIILLLVIAAFIVKQTTSSGNKDSNGYDTYTVKKETPISLEGKASPKSVKTYNNNSQIGIFQSPAVDDGQKVKQGDRLISYDTNNSKRQQLANKVDQAQQQVNDDYQKSIKVLTIINYNLN